MLKFTTIQTALFLVSLSDSLSNFETGNLSILSYGGAVAIILALSLFSKTLLQAIADLTKKK
jgi:hypothetical protein